MAEDREAQAPLAILCTQDSTLFLPSIPPYPYPVWVGFCAYRSSDRLLVTVASRAPPSTGMLRWLLWFRSHSKQKAEAAPTTAQSSKPDQCLPQHFIAQEPLGNISCIPCAISLRCSSTSPEQGDVEEENLPVSIRERESAAA